VGDGAGVAGQSLDGPGVEGGAVDEGAAVAVGDDVDEVAVGADGGPRLSVGQRGAGHVHEGIGPFGPPRRRVGVRGGVSTWSHRLLVVGACGGVSTWGNYAFTVETPRG
jgi:hypothetical protein